MIPVDLATLEEIALIRGWFLLKQYEVFTLGTVSCFSELNNHRLMQIHPPPPENELYYGIGEKGELITLNRLSFILVGLK